MEMKHFVYFCIQFYLLQTVKCVLSCRVRIHYEMSLEWAPSVDMKSTYGSFIVYALGLKVISDNIFIILCLLLV